MSQTRSVGDWFTNENTSSARGQHINQGFEAINLNNGYSSNFMVNSEEPRFHIAIGSENNQRSSRTVVVIGSGDLGKALVACLVRGGYRTIVASRNIEKNRSGIESFGGEIKSYNEAFQTSDIILVAIPYEAFPSLPAELLRNKTIIDVSNRPMNYNRKQRSLAAHLQKLLPESKVVKGFNTLSAYALQRGLIQGSKEIPICSDDEAAKSRVMDLARDLGFTPINRGGLSSAKLIEDIPLSFFEEWKLALLVGFCIYLFFFFYNLFRYQLCDNFQYDKDWDWSLFEKIPLINVHLTFACTTIIMLSACYFPGVIASYLQLYRGTKYSKFPEWLDRWLLSRKQIGILTMYCGSCHMLMAMVDLDGYVSYSFRDCAKIMCGVLTLSLLWILGITSLPSVSANLTWREFSFVQRYLGWCCLSLALLHLICVQWSFLIQNNFKCIFFPAESQIVIFAPLITIAGKIPLLMPCIDQYLQKIRRGYERKSNNN